MNRILLSGGWGYGNIGDDAILMASIALFQDKYPEAEIVITSHDPEYTQRIVGSNYKVLPSVHRTIFGDRAFKYLRTYGQVWNAEALPCLLFRVYGRYLRALKSVSTFDVIQEYINKNGLDEIQKPFKDADMFIMSGGGYFNSWRDSLMSRIMELEFAQKNGVKTFVCGQTLGPFDISEPEESRLTNALKHVSAFYVRDTASLEDLKKWGFDSILAPDMALSQTLCLGEPKKNRIAIVPAELPRQSRRSFVEGMSRIIKSTGMKATVVVTRMYNADIVCAREIYNALSKACGKDNISLIIPKVYSEIESELKNVKYVVSRNLHGIILAWRSGAKCLCMNDERKFATFMQMTFHPENILDARDLTADEVVNKFNEVILQEDSSDRQVWLAQEVRSAFNKLFC